MATTTTITTTYAGEFAGKYISAALLSATTIDNGGIEVKQNIKYKETLKKLATGDLIGDGTCDFESGSSITLTENVIAPEEFQVNLELCKKDFRSDWEAEAMGFSAHDNLPPMFSDFLLAHVIEKVASTMETTIWHGVTANPGEFDGFVTLMTADATVIDVASPAVGGVTADNVLVELGKVVDAIPQEIYTKDDLWIYVAPNVARAYVRALGGFVATIGAAGTDDKGTQWYDGGAGLSFDGVKIFVANGLTASYMVAAQKENLFFGTGLMNDYNEVKVLDMADIDGSQNVRIVMRFTAAVQYAYGAEIVLYTPA
jgi:DNA-binding beta-propeller fold protein YncE